jgi:nucleotide-binding universal stress UspA family protein
VPPRQNSEENMTPSHSDKIAPSVLITVDGSQSSLHAVNYVLHMGGLIPDMKFVLLSIMPQLPPYYVSEAKSDGHMLKKLRKLESLNTQKGHDVLELAKQHLLKHHVDPERIETRLRKYQSGLAKDILNEAELGRFDALVVGRRGLTRAQEIFMGSTTNQLMQHAMSTPLWIVDGKVSEPKVLVAVDGSEASLRAVDHVAFMLGGNPEARVDFLHVSPKLSTYCAIDFDQPDTAWDEAKALLVEMESEFKRDDDVCMSGFMNQAIRTLAQAGFSRDRIKVEEREITLGVARTIIRAAKEGGYGTIVIGRRGLGRSSFLGSVSDRVIRRAEEMAVWLVN